MRAAADHPPYSGAGCLHTLDLHASTARMQPASQPACLVQMSRVIASRCAFFKCYPVKQRAGVHFLRLFRCDVAASPP